MLVHNFTQSLLKDEAGSILATATNWEEIEIEEETESGSSVKSKIRLPVQVRWKEESYKVESSNKNLLLMNCNHSVL